MVYTQTNIPVEYHLKSAASCFLGWFEKQTPRKF